MLRTFTDFANETSPSSYHSHVGSQANTVSGAFIVDEPAANLYHWDEERILNVMDWWHKPDEEMTQGLLAENFKWIGSPNMTLVNGKGLTADLKGEPYYVDVDYDKKYFIRWIGAQGLQYYVSVDELLRPNFFACR